MHNREKGSVEARLATVRLGLFTITTFVVLVLLALSAVIYVGFSNANDAPDSPDYSIGDYIGDIGPVIIPSILIVLVAALAINFGYAFWLRNQEGGAGEG